MNEYLEINLNMLAVLMSSMVHFNGTRNRKGIEFTAVFKRNSLSSLETLLKETELTDYFEYAFMDKRDKVVDTLTNCPVILVNLSFANSSEMVIKLLSETHHPKGWRIITKIDHLTPDLESTDNPHVFINQCNRYFYLERNRSQ